MKLKHLIVVLSVVFLASISMCPVSAAVKQRGTQNLDALVERHLSEQLLCHISRNAAAIEGNEKPIKKKEEAPKATGPAKKGRPKKDEQRKIKEEKRLDKQVRQTAAEALQELPTD